MAPGPQAFGAATVSRRQTRRAHHKGASLLHDGSAV